MSATFLKQWMDGKFDAADRNVCIYRERVGMRSAVLPAIHAVVLDHLVGLSVIEIIGGYPKASGFIRNRLPVDKKMRSADIGEILAAEYVVQLTDYFVPLKKLRHRDDRAVAMRGDDVVGLREKNGKYDVLKVEAKSGKVLASATVKKAGEALMKHSGRPNPATLAFMSHQLRLNGEDSLAEIVEKLQSTDISEQQIEHLIFACTGNDPLNALKANAVSSKASIRRTLVGVVIVDHQEFIQAVFEALNG